MNTPNTNFKSPRLAFTLIELLVVIAVIGVLAALIFPAVGAIKIGAIKKRVQSELKYVESAIEAYKDNVKVYPPENRNNPALNPLYYELAGTKLAGSEYQPLVGSGNITVANLNVFFGAGNVTGFLNVSRGSEDELKVAKDCLPGLRPAQYLEVQTNGVSGIVLGTREKGPAPFMLSDAAGLASINPFRYLSSSATNNAGRFDLWVDVLINGKTNRFSNWRDKPFDPNL
ncbi:MAG: type II secretion system protein [Verrucomicrobiota bacterium]